MAWIYLVLFHGGFWRVSDESGLAAPGPASRVAVVIPARDEAEVIGRAIRSLDCQPVEIILVDDHSTDGTAECARQASERVVVIPAQPLPPGWTGKLWAVSQGLHYALQSQPDYVLLTDADIEHSPDSIKSLVARAEGGGFDLVSYMVRLRNEAHAEMATVPAFVFFFLKLYPPAWIQNPKRTTAGAAGGCMLVRSTALQRIGGVDRIRSEMIDDCALAREIKGSGGRVWLGLSSTTRSLRRYSGFRDVAEMVSRTAYTQLRHSPVLLAGTVLGMLLIYVVPPLATAFGIWTGLVAWLLMTLAFMPILRFYRQSPLWAPLLPFIAGFYTFATLQSAVRYWSGRGGNWKGRIQDARRR